MLSSCSRESGRRAFRMSAGTGATVAADSGRVASAAGLAATSVLVAAAAAAAAAPEPLPLPVCCRLHKLGHPKPSHIMHLKQENSMCTPPLARGQYKVRQLCRSERLSTRHLLQQTCEYAVSPGRQSPVPHPARAAQ